MSNRADRAFAKTGLTPTQAFALICISEEPGASPSDIAEKLNIAPSTVTRAVDQLKARGFAESSSTGRAVDIHPTDDGRAMVQPVKDAWRDLYEDYCTQIDRSEADQLSFTLAAVNDKLRGRSPRESHT